MYQALLHGLREGIRHQCDAVHVDAVLVSWEHISLRVFGKTAEGTALLKTGHSNSLEDVCFQEAISK